MKRLLSTADAAAARDELLGFASLLVLLVCAVVGLSVGFLSFRGDLLGAGRYQTGPVPLGLAVPMSPSPPSAEIPHAPTQVGQAAVELTAQQDLGDWRKTGKGSAARIALAKLATGRDIEAVNEYLGHVRPWSSPGSTWPLHKGDYDFTEVTLTAVLWMFGDQPDRLYPETVAHMLDTLLLEEGGTPDPMVPGTFGLVLDTENHHLMREGSRYLKNQWLFENGPEGQRGNPEYDNVANGLETWLVAHLQEMIDEGIYEFNSIPYLKYTLEALLNLDAFPHSIEITQRARYLLDMANWQYAIGSLDLRRCAPFRRRVENAGETRLDDDRHTALMRVWMSPPYDPNAAAPSRRESSQASIITELLPYRLPDDVREWTRHKTHDYYVRIGRGPKASPEVYSGGPGYLLSTGGVHRGYRSMISARPNTLMLSDGAMDLNECCYIRGRGSYKAWNNTGVCRHFMCGNSPVYIPERYASTAVAAEGWQVFAPEAVPGLLVAAYSAEDLGLIVLFPESAETPDVLLGTLAKANSDPEILYTTFTWPDGKTVDYDVEAVKGTWVIASIDGQPADRDYDAWPQVSGDPPAMTFERRAAGS